MLYTLFRRSLTSTSPRSFSTATATMASSPFTRAVVNSMRKLYPEVLADKSFDNTGLLLEAPFDPSRRLKNSTLLTVDLTRAVADEAIENKYSVIVTYHPIIFRGLKSLTLADSQQLSLLKLATAGISVYSPHTAVDAVPGGMADWLCDIVAGKLDGPEPETHTVVNRAPNADIKDESSAKAFARPDLAIENNNDSRKSSGKANQSKAQRPGALDRTYSRPSYPTPTPVSSTPLHPDTVRHTRTVINPSPTSSLDSAIAATASSTPYNASNTGHGRLLIFSNPQSLTNLIERIARGVGTPKGFPVAIPQDFSVEDIKIQTVAICPGSGSSLLKNTTADLVFAGELSHHEALSVIERGGCVITLFHSNSERGYLLSRMKGSLEATLKEEWGNIRKELEEEKEADTSEAIKELLRDESVSVQVSTRDRDPFGIVVLQDSEVEGSQI